MAAKFTPNKALKNRLWAERLSTPLPVFLPLRLRHLAKQDAPFLYQEFRRNTVKIEHKVNKFKMLGKIFL
jgi:hypothetical protein